MSCPVAIDADWIGYWSERYDAEHPDYDDEVLNKIGPRVLKRGWYDRADLLAVGKWKTARVLPQLESNTDDMIRDITRTALAAPEPIQHLVMTLLNGVGVPVASSLLMVWKPKVHTVIDVRAVNSLIVNRELTDPAPLYPDYLKACRKVSQRCGRSLRIVDRALYKANGRSADT